MGFFSVSNFEVPSALPRNIQVQSVAETSFVQDGDAWEGQVAGKQLVPQADVGREAEAGRGKPGSSHPSDNHIHA